MSDIKSLLLGGPSTPEDIQAYRKVLVRFAENIIVKLPEIDKDHGTLYTDTPVEYELKTLKVAMPKKFWDALEEISYIHKTRQEMDIVFDGDGHKDMSEATNNAYKNSSAAAGSDTEGTLSNLLMESILDFSFKIAEAHLKAEIAQAIVDNDIDKMMTLLDTVVKLGFAPEGMDEFNEDPDTDDVGDETEE